jgi:putative PEP-CTERM system histidine kinase
VTASTFTTAATWSYGIAMALYALFGVRVALGWRGSARASLLVGALAMSVLWAGGAVVAARTSEPLAVLLMNAGDLGRYGLWITFLGNLLAGSTTSALPHDARSRRAVILPIAAALVACLALSKGLPFAAWIGPSAAQIELALRLGFAILGLVMIEQLIRRAHSQFRWSLRPLAVALGGLFGFDLFLYSDAMLFSEVDVDFWIARGAAHALVIPFVAVATARNTGWTIDLHVSRGAVFHSTALVVSGVFLLMVASAGYFVRYFGGEWGPALQIELLFAALLCVVLVATSGRFRSTLRVFVSKHFFSYRYDYREEWLRFTRTLAQEGVQRLPERVLMALADLVESPGGALWMREEGRGFVPADRFNVPLPDAAEPVDGSLARFLERTGWVIDLADYREDSTRYASLDVPQWLAQMPDAWLVVPLPTANELVGFVVLTTPRVPVEVDWEVRDVMKTASRQAASYLAQVRASEALLEARKFDAFNRMSAFVVHDLKNLVAQLSLLLRNAERHRGNPEFQRDMLSTVEHVVERMNKLMLQLRTGTTPVDKPHAIELGPLVRRVCAVKSQAGRTVEVDAADEVATLGHEERLEHVIGHLVQNALDATGPGDAVRVRAAREDGSAVLEVTDAGEGMSEEFVRERLGKPFETTKASGMGIGVYESSQYVTSLGGRIVIDSAPGRGTRVRVVLPLKDNAPLQPGTRAGTEELHPAPAAAGAGDADAGMGPEAGMATSVGMNR